VVRWLGAVQAQDYPGALWAIGVRLPQATEAAVEQAIAQRRIVRTWPMRGTLHFVATADVRWMLALLTPRTIARSVRRLQRDYAITPSVMSRSRRALERALRDGRPVPRPAVYRALESARIETKSQRGLHILWRLSQEGVLCHGPRAEKQPTFVLLDAWVPPARPLDRSDALVELARRYFTSHGPATVQDFSWWSGLTASDARAGLEGIERRLTRVTTDGRTYWQSDHVPRPKPKQAFLLPAYDEYCVAYRDRSGILAPSYAKRRDAGYGILSPTMVYGGQVVGTWQRTLTGGSIVVRIRPFARLEPGMRRAFAVAARRLGRFVGLPALLQEEP
jgi:hypothetical protein